MIVGIDPGISGAIALLDPTTRELTVHYMPTAKKPNGKTTTDIHTLARLLIPSSEGRQIAMLELVHARPHDGKSSAFQFGENFGAVQMAVVGHSYETHFVTPAVWKKHFNLRKTQGMTEGQFKEASRRLAMMRFPEHAATFEKVKDDGRAEAALVALYALETIV